MNELVGTTAYETWVNTLRAWRDDPLTPLDGLPVLREDMYTPDTFGRLIAQLTKAMQVVSDRWHDGLARTWEQARTPHDMARELVALRATLARRGQLASHQSLPEPIRDALQKGFRSDVEKWQAELEDAVRTQHSRYTLNMAYVDTMLQVVRQNSLLAVLSYDTGTGARRPGLRPLPERDQRNPILRPATRGANRRRVIVLPSDAEIDLG